MAIIKKTVEITTTVDVEFDDSLIPNDEWREQFYPIKDDIDLAKHFAFNALFNEIEDLTELDGFADRDDSLMKVDVDREPIDIDVY